MKKVLVLSQFYHPDIAATGQVMRELCEDIALDEDKKVTVITGQPYTRKGNTKKSKSYEVLNNVEVYRINYLRLNKENILGRLVGFFSFTISALMKLLIVRQYDTILIVSNPPVLPFLGYMIKIFTKKRFVFLLHDLYPDVALKMGVISEKSIMTRLMNWINARVFRSTDSIVVLGRDAKELLVEKKNVDPSKIKIITNWADKEVIDKRNDIRMKEKLEIKEEFMILYTGNIGLFYDLEYVIAAFQQVQDLEDICMVFVGEGNKKAELQSLIEEKGIKNVYFRTYQPLEYYGDMLQSADVLLVASASGIEGISIPSKTYGYLAAGKPLLGVLSEKSEIGQVIKENQCGVQVNPRNVGDIEKAIRSLYFDEKMRKKMGSNSRKAFEIKYQREIVTKKFNELL
jgi:glycosyltransferase involved in cell wall biosynthesis